MIKHNRPEERTWDSYPTGASTRTSEREQGQNSMFRTPGTPISIRRLLTALLLACPKRWEALSPAAPGAHSPSSERASVLIRKTPGLQHLVPSLAHLCANHILESEEKRESPSLKCRRGTVPPSEGSPAGIQADTGPVDGCQSSITDFKMLRVCVPPEGDIFHFYMN